MKIWTYRLVNRYRIDPINVEGANVEDFEYVIEIYRDEAGSFTSTSRSIRRANGLRSSWLKRFRGRPRRSTCSAIVMLSMEANFESAGAVWA